MAGLGEARWGEAASREPVPFERDAAILRPVDTKYRRVKCVASMKMARSARPEPPYTGIEGRDEWRAAKAVRHRIPRNVDAEG
mgnify:CR=1 FL=1